MNINKAHEYYDITDTFDGKEVTGSCTYTEHDNLQIQIVIKDAVNGNTEAQVFISDVPGNDVSLSMVYQGNFNLQLSKYLLDAVEAVKNSIV
jgi:hypothetical protein